MTIGEVIAALTKYASDINPLIITSSIYEISVDSENSISIVFVDGNTPDLTITIE